MLVFGLVGPVGSPLDKVGEFLAKCLAQENYTCRTIKLSDFLMELETADSKSEYERLNHLMNVGNRLRKETKYADVLAMCAIADIEKERRDSGTDLAGHAYIIRQLKHPAEVRLLRQVYGDSFHLIGVHTPESVRKWYLVKDHDMQPTQAEHLIRRDSGEESDFGQHVTDTFHLSDLIVPALRRDTEGLRTAELQVQRYVTLLFGRAIHTPSVDEYGMFFAFAASLRSADLSRQVGAAILTKDGELVATGANEVPRAGGGQYWEGSPGDDRDFQRKHDSNERKKWECVREIVECLNIIDGWDQLGETEQRSALETVVQKLENTRIMHLTEFGRAVHAEMEAILSAARLGVSVARRVLYTTTFPCHNCAKHIVGAGISRVVYVEPYAKSLADQLHGDSIAFSLDEAAEGKVLFEPFTGVTPRRFPQLFSMVDQDGRRRRRKQHGGDLALPTGPRVALSRTNYADLEKIVSETLRKILEKLDREGILREHPS